MSCLQCVNALYNTVTQINCKRHGYVCIGCSFVNLYEYVDLLCQSDRKKLNEQSVDDDVEDVLFDIQHTAPQHRQYLSHDVSTSVAL